MTDTTDKVAFAAAELLAASEALASAAAEVDALRAELARQTGIAVAGRWVPAAERDEVMAERDAAIAARDEAVARLEKAKGESYRLGGLADERGVLLKEAERARDEVGIQLAAAQERIKLLEKVAKEARAVLEDHDRSMIHLDDAVSALDAVPGDALVPVVRGAPFDEAGTVNPDRITAALEASGIDTGNVKGLE